MPSDAGVPAPLSKPLARTGEGWRDFYRVDGGFALVFRYVAAMSCKLQAMLVKAWTNCQASQSMNPATPI